MIHAEHADVHSLLSPSRAWQERGRGARRSLRHTPLGGRRGAGARVPVQARAVRRGAAGICCRLQPAGRVRGPCAVGACRIRRSGHHRNLDPARHHLPLVCRRRGMAAQRAPPAHACADCGGAGQVYRPGRVRQRALQRRCARPQGRAAQARRAGRGGNRCLDDRPGLGHRAARRGRRRRHRFDGRRPPHAVGGAARAGACRPRRL